MLTNQVLVSTIHILYKVLEQFVHANKYSNWIKSECYLYIIVFLEHYNHKLIE